MSNEQVQSLQPGESITPKISVDQCKILIVNLYGLKVKSIIELASYDDKNYKVITEEYYDNKYISEICGNGYILKILNKLDSKKIQFIDAQKEMMLFLNKNNIRCSKPVQNKLGEYYSLEQIEDSGDHIVRLLEYIPGEIFFKVPPTKELYYNAGEYLGNIDFVLKDFYHEAYKTHHHPWMMESVSDIRKFLYVIKNEEDVNMIEEILIEFNEKVLRQMGVLEKSHIHGDFNEQNIIVKQQDKGGEWCVDAILDFGDTQYACILFEIAIAVTYMIIQANDIKMARFFLAGYSKIRPITNIEFNLLPICVAARFCQSLVMGTYCNTLHPDNKYVLTTQTNGWILLRQLWSMQKETLIDTWKNVA